MSKTTVTPEKQHRVEEQIRQEQKQVDYKTLDYPIALLVDKYLTGIADNSNELFIPDSRKGIPWDNQRQSRLIEFILLRLPIVALYVSEVSSQDDAEDGRLEIIDGSQRLQTIARFLRNELTLSNLTQLTALNGVRFLELPDTYQNKFKGYLVRVVQFTQDTSEEDRQDFYERLNS